MGSGENGEMSEGSPGLSPIGLGRPVWKEVGGFGMATTSMGPSETIKA